MERDDLLRCRPLNLLNLYSFPTRNLLDLVARDLAACISAEFFLLWSSPLIPLKMNPPTFLISCYYFSKDVTTFENGSYASDKSTKKSFVSLQSHIVMLFCIYCICFQRYGFSILGYIVQCPTSSKGSGSGIGSGSETSLLGLLLSLSRCSGW